MYMYMYVQVHAFQPKPPTLPQLPKVITMQHIMFFECDDYTHVHVYACTCTCICMYMYNVPLEHF